MKHSEMDQALSILKELWVTLPIAGTRWLFRVPSNSNQSTISARAPFQGVPGEDRTTESQDFRGGKEALQIPQPNPSQGRLLRAGC